MAITHDMTDDSVELDERESDGVRITLFGTEPRIELPYWSRTNGQVRFSLLPSGETRVPSTCSTTPSPTRHTVSPRGLQLAVWPLGWSCTERTSRRRGS